MQQALELHNNLLRKLMLRFSGYEAEGDAFMAAFPSARDALAFCCAAQLDLLSVAWPAAVLGAPGDTDTVTDKGGAVVFRGLRVRMGVHAATHGAAAGHNGPPMLDRDPTTGRGDYFGPMVNFAARVSSKGRGGEIVLSAAAHAAVAPLLDGGGDGV
eukprot:gene15210-20774_t